MLEKVDTRGRIVLGAGALYLILLLAIVAYTAIEFRDLYTVPKYTNRPAVLERSGEYKQFLRVPGLALALCLGTWGAALGWWRSSYWQGLAASAAAAAVTAIALTFLPFVFFPFDQYPASFEWVRGSVVPAVLIWILVTALARMLFRETGPTAVA